MLDVWNPIQFGRRYQPKRFWICHLVFEHKPFDLKRNLNFFTMGAAYIAPCLHFWYCKALPKISAQLFSNASKFVKVFGSMLFDQLLFAPVLLTGFFAFNGLVVERSLSGAQKGIKDCKEKLWETLQANWKIWPLASTINFWFMPVQYQVLFANFVGLFWNVILSFISNKWSFDDLFFNIINAYQSSSKLLCFRRNVVRGPVRVKSTKFPFPAANAASRIRSLVFSSPLYLQRVAIILKWVSICLMQ